MSTNTTILQLAKQDKGDADFHVPLNAALDTIDSLLGAALLIRGTAGEAIDAYEVGTVNGSGNLVLADASDPAISGKMLGIADADIAGAASGNLRTRGVFTNGSWAWSGARTPLYLSESTPGALTETRPSLSSPVVAVALSATSIYFSPDLTRVRVAQVALGPLSGGEAFYVPLDPGPGTVRGMMIVSDTATSGSDGSNNWQFTLYNLTQAQNVAQDDTNGNELSTDGWWVAAAPANPDLAALDVLELQVALTGAATALSSARLRLLIVYEDRLT